MIKDTKYGLLCGIWKEKTASKLFSRKEAPKYGYTIMVTMPRNKMILLFTSCLRKIKFNVNATPNNNDKVKVNLAILKPVTEKIRFKKCG